MKTFKEYQARASEFSASLRNNRDRINLPTTGLQEEAGKIGSLLTKAFTAGNSGLNSDERCKLQNRLADVLWYLALFCEEAKLSMEDVAECSLLQLEARTKENDLDQR